MTSDDSHELQITTPGVYSFCIDNSFSSLTSKMVYLDLGIMREEEDFSKDATIETVYNVYVSTFRLFFQSLSIHLCPLELGRVANRVRAVARTLIGAVGFV